jgi:hypothetical protein
MSWSGECVSTAFHYIHPRDYDQHHRSEHLPRPLTALDGYLAPFIRHIKENRGRTCLARKAVR